MGEEIITTQVKDLRPDSSSTNLVGLVICKHSPRRFKDSRSHDQSSSQRCVLSFTIRDATGYVNCSLWGNEEFIETTSSEFHIGDKVIVMNAQLNMKSNSDEVFNPTNSCPFSLSISEKQGGRVAYCDQDHPELKFLCHAPIRPNNDYYTLAEIFEQGESMDGQYVNVLAVVKKISDVHQLVTKNGKELEKLEVTFFDNTTDAFTAVVWEREYFGYIQQWTEKRSVIFAVDVRLSFNKFKNCIQGTFTNKTVCVIDPDTKESHQLYDYALEYVDQMEELFGDGKDERDSSSVRNEDLKVYTIAEILDDCGQLDQQSLPDGTVKPRFIRGILYATMTSFNIDINGRHPWCLRCSSCRYRLAAGVTDSCPNEKCVTKEEPSKFLSEKSFDMQMSLSDHTGTLDQCRIGGKSVEKMFGLTVDSFECLTASDVTDLKWAWLMERCKIQFRYTMDHPAAKARVEICEKTDLEEALHAIRA